MNHRRHDLLKGRFPVGLLLALRVEGLLFADVKRRAGLSVSVDADAEGLRGVARDGYDVPYQLRTGGCVFGRTDSELAGGNGIAPRMFRVNIQRDQRFNVLVEFVGVLVVLEHIRSLAAQILGGYDEPRLSQPHVAHPARIGFIQRIHQAAKAIAV